jgi:antitoxin CptB
MNEVRVKRAKLRAWRRGFREVDLILGPFADERAASMNASELGRFERLLEQNDHDLYAWIVGAVPTPPEFDDTVMAALRASAWAPHKSQGD